MNNKQDSPISSYLIEQEGERIIIKLKGELGFIFIY